MLAQTWANGAVSTINTLTYGMTLIFAAAAVLALMYDLTIWLFHPFGLGRLGVLRILGIAFLAITLPNLLALILVNVIQRNTAPTPVSAPPPALVLRVEGRHAL